MSQPVTGATANPTGPTGTANPKPGSKIAEDVALDKLQAKMNKDVAMKNARRADRRKELTAQGKDPMDVSEDGKDDLTSCSTYTSLKVTWHYVVKLNLPFSYPYDVIASYEFTSQPRMTSQSPTIQA
ncbi:hypothetical protein F5146DRAFT_1133359 [Armillaria mellea]|nr:hypothetical protein F5146DRAFT_1133359 [Armillaria mellea]